MTEIALHYGNVTALQALASLQSVATAEIVSSLEGLQTLMRAASKGDTVAPLLFFQLRRHLKGRYHQTLRDLARSTIIKSAIRISGSGLRPETITQVPFYPGLDEFDLDATFEHTLNKVPFSTYTDIVGIERKSRKKIGTIILDTSGSMTGPKLITSALAAAVAAYHLRHDQYALIAFNTAAQTIKTMNQTTTIDYIVDTILDTEPAGFTNITDGLETAFAEYQRSRRRESWAVLITDGIANRGGSPYPHASRYHSLHVLQTPGIHPQGKETCKRIADLGGGHHIKVNDYTDVPYALMKLLRYTR